ncbi:MerR family transcriptional regulator [Actinomadura sp. ATCC 39365]
MNSRRPITLDEVLKRGLAYRTLAQWSRRGLVHTTPSPSGTYVWPETELRVADLMRRLVRAGLTVEAAARTARAHQEGPPLVQLGPGIVLAIDTDLLSEAT